MKLAAAREARLGPAERGAALGSSTPAWPRLGARAGELIHREGSLRLVRFAPARPAARPPLLLVTPLINRAYIVDLTPETSLVGALAEAGVDTFVVDWGRPTLADAGLGLEDVTGALLRRCEARVRQATGAAEVVLAGYCLGGTVATIRAARAAAAGEDGIAGLVTIHGPVSFAEAGRLGGMTAREAFPLDGLLDAFDNMPGWLLQQGFGPLRPLGAVANARRLWDIADDPAALEEHAALDLWNADNVPVPGAFYRRLIEDLYRGDRLARGELEIEDRRVDLGAIRCPTLAVAAEDDPICLPGQAKALLDLVSSPVKRLHMVRGGHIRSVIGPAARHSLASEIAAWPPRP